MYEIEMYLNRRSLKARVISTINKLKRAICAH